MESHFKQIGNVLILKKFQANIYSHLIIAGIISIGIYFFLGIYFFIFSSSFFIITIILGRIQPKFNQVEFLSYAIEFYNQKTGHLVKRIPLEDIKKYNFEYVNNHLYGYSNHALILHLQFKNNELFILDLSNYINSSKEETLMLSYILSTYFFKSNIMIDTNLIT